MKCYECLEDRIMSLTYQLGINFDVCDDEIFHIVTKYECGEGHKWEHVSHQDYCWCDRLNGL